MGRFRKLVEDLSLNEVPLFGRKYTWSNQQDSPVLVKLDRVLCSVEWEDIFPNVLLQSAASEGSDHCPLLLGIRDNKLGKRRFCFEAFWPKLEGFQDVIQEVWDSVAAVNCPFMTLNLKLKATARKLQSWSGKHVGHVRTQLALAKEILHRLEIAQDSRSLSLAEIWLSNLLKKHSLFLSSLQRTIARSRSRISWLKEGDANTKLFHMHSRHRKRRNFVAELVNGDQILTSHDDKAVLVDNFYARLIGECGDREQTINLEALHMPTFNLAHLDEPVTELELWNTIKSLPNDKAPGPDGFTGRFYKSCWNIIKMDLMAVVAAVWNKKFDNFCLLNSAFITLIPKHDGAVHVKDFRPISLVHSAAKLITKLLANRLSQKLNDMVSPIQSAFIKGRFIQDNFMLVQQTTRFLLRQNQACILLNLQSV